jgi:internalin A
MRTETGYGSSSSERDILSRMPLPSIMNNGFSSDQITTLELDSCNLFNLDPLPNSYYNCYIRLPSLRWASFRNNFIQDVKKLLNYGSLQELSLENNHLADVECLAALSALTKLNLSNNSIRKIEWNPPFKSLMLLSLEKNYIKVLRPFSKIATLMELCISV